MLSKISDRQVQIEIIFTIMMLLLAGRLFQLTVIQNDKWADAATNLSIKSVYTSAPRGEIRDRYGRLIAGNKESFVVNLIAAEVDEDSINDVALNLINLFDANGDTYNDDFPIMIDENGNFYYSYDKSVQEWLASQDLNTSLSAKDAFQALREREGVDESLDVYDAQSALQNTYSVYPPISVKKMEYTYTLERNNFIKGFSFKDADGNKIEVDENTDAKTLFGLLRDKYEIDSSLSDADARKIMIVRNALKNLGYKSYLPAQIASGVSEKTIITLEERSASFPGVDVDREYVRVYPNGTTACHVIGYIGKISESEKDDYVEKGYSSTDLIGKEGIEKYYESELKGTAGKKEIQVNNLGQQVSEISSEPAIPGNDVYLTIDLELQKTAEDALQEALDQISIGGTFHSKYGNYNYSKAYRNANVGAAVAVDVKTGEVLALANNPGYDPNLFANGISTEDWNSLQGENPRDPLSPLPLYNVSTMASLQPGSTFKPVTALAGLNAGFNENRQLYDNGAIIMGGRSFGCWIWNQHKGARHGYLDIRHALEVSCNYFFYDLGSGYDYYGGHSLGIDMDISKVMDYAEKLGLGQKTGIELAESAAGVPSEEKKTASVKNSLKYMLKLNASKYFKPELTDDDDKLEETIDTIVSWADEKPKRAELYNRLKNMSVLDDQLDTLTDTIRSDYFSNAKWGVGDSLNLSIGQGENEYTPVQMARYVAALANDGLLHKLTLTKSVEGQEKEEDPGVQVENSNSEAYEVVREGMHLVAQGSKGSGRGVFGSFPYDVAAKTGSAQKSGKINPPDEVEYIKQHLSGIAPGITFEQVETEMKRLMKEESDIYKSESTAVRRAVINLAGVSTEKIDAYKSSYDAFAWFIAYAPIEDPQIAVAVLIYQGGSGGYAGPVAREIIGKYMELQEVYSDYTDGETSFAE